MFGKRSKQQSSRQQWREPTATPPQATISGGDAEGEGGESDKKPDQPAAAQPARPAKPDPSAVLNRQPASPIGGSRSQRAGGDRQGRQQQHGRQAQEADDEGDDSTLFVGQNIRMSGEIAQCSKLTVEGSVEADLSRTRALYIAESGHVKGAAVVDVAEIAGRFEGTLVVRERLNVRTTGQVHGTIRYRALEIESGGRIGGTLEELSADAAERYREDESAAFDREASEAPASPDERAGRAEPEIPAAPAPDLSPAAGRGDV